MQTWQLSGCGSDKSLKLCAYDTLDIEKSNIYLNVFYKVYMVIDGEGATQVPQKKNGT